MINFQEKANFNWSVVDLLRGDYKQSEYGKVILPLTVLRRLNCVLEPTKQQVLEKIPTITSQNIAPIINRLTGQTFYNTSRYDFSEVILAEIMELEESIQEKLTKVI